MIIESRALYSINKLTQQHQLNVQLADGHTDVYENFNSVASYFSLVVLH